MNHDFHPTHAGIHFNLGALYDRHFFSVGGTFFSKEKLVKQYCECNVTSPHVFHSARPLFPLHLKVSSHRLTEVVLSADVYAFFVASVSNFVTEGVVTCEEAEVLHTKLTENSSIMFV